MADEMAVEAARNRGASTVTSGASGRSRGRGARGAVTAEAAVVIPVLVALCLGLVWVISLAVTQVRVVDAAREAVRAAARGDDAGGGAADPGSPDIEVAVATHGDEVTAVAEAEVGGPGGIFGFLPGLTVTSRATAVREPE